MQYRFLIVLTLLFQLSAYAQQSDPDFPDTRKQMDYMGGMTFGLQDPIYSSKATLPLSYVLENNFIAGSYYDQEGKRHDGYINLNENLSRFQFLQSRDTDSPIKVRVEEIQSIVLGADSMVVFNTAKVEGGFSDMGSSKQPLQLMQVLPTVKKTPFWAHYYYTIHRSVWSYVYEKEGKYYKVPQKKKPFKAFALQHFGDIPHLRQGIEAGDYRYKDFRRLILASQLHACIEEQKPVWYDKNLQAQDFNRNCTDCPYYALVESPAYNQYQYTYYTRAGNKFYTVQVQGLYPHEGATGTAVWFNEEGLKVRTMLHRKGVTSKQLTTYRPSGKRHHVFEMADLSYASATMVHLYDSTGKRLVDMNGTITDVVFDPRLNTDVIYEYKKLLLTRAYYLTAERKKVVLYDRKRPVKLRQPEILQQELEGRFDYLWSKENIDSRLSGMLWIQVSLQPDGRLTDLKVVEGIEPGFDERLLVALQEVLTQNSFTLRKKPSDEVQRYDLLVPFAVGVDELGAPFNPYAVKETVAGFIVEVGFNALFGF